MPLGAVKELDRVPEGDGALVVHSVVVGYSVESYAKIHAVDGTAIMLAGNGIGLGSMALLSAMAAARAWWRPSPQPIARAAARPISMTRERCARRCHGSPGAASRRLITSWRRRRSTKPGYRPMSASMFGAAPCPIA